MVVLVLWIIGAVINMVLLYEHGALITRRDIIYTSILSISMTYICILFCYCDFMSEIENDKSVTKLSKWLDKPINWRRK